MFESNDGLVSIDRDAPKPKIPFIKLHEAGYGRLPHQSKMYKLVADCERTLDPYITDLFEREAKCIRLRCAFSGRCLFQRSARADLQHQGADEALEEIRRLELLDLPALRHDKPVSLLSGLCWSPAIITIMATSPPRAARHHVGVIREDLRRAGFRVEVDASHCLASLVPLKRMCYPREVLLLDRNGDERVCRGESFNTTHHTLVLLRDVGLRNHAGIVVPAHAF